MTLIFPRAEIVRNNIFTKPNIVFFTLIAIIAICLSFYAIYFFGSADINGKRVFFLNDDMMISMRYANNLVNGQGFSFNPQKHFNKDEPVEGYSNFLWVMVMVAVHILRINMDMTSLIMQLLNLCLVTMIAFFIYMFLKRDTNPIIGFSGALLYLSFPGQVFFISGGFEVYLETIFLLFGLFYFLKDDYLKVSLILGFLPLLHNKFYSFSIISLIIIFILLLKKDGYKKAFQTIVIASIPILLHLLFRVAYYKELLPNTYYLKVVGINGLFNKGLSYAYHFIYLNRFLVVLMILGLIIKPNKNKFVLASIFLIYTFFIVLMGGDVFIYYRFFYPVLPLIILGSLLFLGGFLEDEKNKKIILQLFKCAIICLLLFFYMNINTSSISTLQEVDKKINPRRVLMGKYFGSIPTDCRIAIFGAGITPYFSDKQFIDMLGKADKHIARLKPKSGMTGHNKYDYDYVLAQEPDFIDSIVEPKNIANSKYIKEMAAKENALSFFYYLPQNKCFINKYSKNPLIAKNGLFLFYYAKNKDLASNISFVFLDSDYKFFKD